MPRTKRNYQPLVDYLNGQNLQELYLTFSEIEALISQPLPASAKKYYQFWENGADTANRPQRIAMLKTPFDTKLRTIEGRVLFVRRT